MNTKHLLQEALQKQQAIRELEVKLETAKDSYLKAVREAHLSGMSLREIASFLKISHQRIHQLVEEGNKRALSWLRPVNPVLCCSFCGRSSDQANKLVAGPDMFICMCDGCAQSCLDVLIKGVTVSMNETNFRLLNKSERLRCSFCNKVAGARRAMVAGKEQQICASCVDLSLKHMREEAAHPGLA